jgi:ATPase subunit of ABC transporter with duplicated ATPase domains
MVFPRLFLTHLRQNPRHTKITPLQNKFSKNTSTSVDDDLRVLVRKLRVGQDDLRNRQEELHGGQKRHEELIQNLLQKGGDHQA